MMSRFLLLFVLLWLSACAVPPSVQQTTSESIHDAAVADKAKADVTPDTRESVKETSPEPHPEPAPEPMVEKKPTTWNVKRLVDYVPGGHGLAIAPDKTIFMSDTYGRIKAGVKAVYRLKAPYTEALEDTGIRVVSPSGLLWHKGFLYVCDLQGNKVLKVDQSFKVLQQWSATTPWNLSIDGKGQLYALSYNGMVQRLQEKSAPVTMFSGLQNPFDLHVLNNGHFWVSEQGPNGTLPGRITLRDSTGKVLKSLVYKFVNPEGLAVTPDGAVWVAETGTGELLRFAPDGKVIVVASQLALPVNLHLMEKGGLLLSTVGGAAGKATVFQIQPTL